MVRAGDPGETMSAPKLIIRKKMLLIQGKVRPCCHVQAKVDAPLQAILDEHFGAEPLFKRAAYAQNWPKGAIEIPGAIAPALTQFLKNDACPEITVKTLTSGQMHQAGNAWEMMAFELVSKLAFDNFVALCTTISEMGQDVVYQGHAADLAAFEADRIADQALVVETEIAA